MTNAIPTLEHLRFFLSAPHPCGYLDNLEASEIWADTSVDMTTAIYSHLSNMGFRRSGNHVYRPRCEHCNACIPVRLDIARFTPSRSQRRCWQQNQDVDITISTLPAQDYTTLFLRYIQSRHPGGAMDTPDASNPTDFLGSEWCDTRFHEFRLNGKLIAVATVDHLIEGLSAVYTFFDPEYSPRSLGVYAVLHQIELARQQQLRWLYLGYWIQDCRKMAYKNQYQPLQHYREGRWQQILD